jgi:hypothetical protein
MDQRIADYIARNQGRYTREAIRQQLIDAGHDPADIDATWAILDTPDPDEAGVAGEGFWPRFFLFLIGLNVAVFLLVALSTGMLGNLAFGGGAIAGVFAVALGIGALLAWAIVAAVGPAKLGRTTAIVIGGVIPLVFALLIGGSCYALASAIGPPPPPPREGVMELEIEAPMRFSGSGAAFCQIPADGSGFSIYTQEGRLGMIDGRQVHASVDSFSPGLGPEGGPAPEPAASGEPGRSVSVYIFLFARTESDPPRDWFASPDTQLEIDADPDGLSGTVTFEGLEPPQSDGPPQEPMSGTIRWSCEETAP